MSLELIQITDLHLYAERTGRLREVVTWDSFDIVRDHIRATHPDFDYLIITGDVAQDESATTYAMLREALGDWLERSRLIPGNHDDRAAMRAVFPEHFDAGRPTLDFELVERGWRLLGLDSQVTGEVYGTVSMAQMEWLTARMAGDALPAVLFVHHPPAPISVQWLDSNSFVDGEPFVHLLERSPRIRALFCGHVHQAHAGRIGTAAFHTTPSTCIQFGRSAERSFERGDLGYRHITLDTDGCHSEVCRLTGAVAA